MPIAINPLTTLERTTIYQVFGIPPGGLATILTSFTHIPPVLAQSWSPTYTVGNLSALNTQLNNSMDLATDDQCTLIRTELANWSSVGATDPMRIDRSAVGDEGVVIDKPLYRENIRRAIGELLGFAFPMGGFWADINRKFAYVREMEGNGDR